MKKDIKYIVTVLRLLVDLITEFASTINEKANLKEISDQLPNLLNKILENLNIQEQPIQGVTKQKRASRNKLEQSLYPVMTILHDYAQQHGDEKLMEEMKTSTSRLSHISAEALLTQARNTINFCTSKGEELPNHGIATEMFDTLQTNFNLFREVVAKPKKLMNRRKEATRQLDILGDKSEYLIYKRMYPLMESYFILNNPSLWKKFQFAVSPGRIPTHKLAVQGNILDTETGEPITNIWLEVQGTDIAYRAKGKKGQFRIQHLEPGNYRLSCIHANYYPLSVEFTQVWGETTRLNLKLQMTNEAKRKKQEKDEKKEKQLAKPSVT
ncbi:MAG: carboxypeptidase-like regulatory domain-containing protein [Marinifilaceae bacterium]